MRYAILIELLAILHAAGCGGPNDALPSVSDIKGLKAEFEGKEFDIPRSHWGNIFAALRPMKQDDNPAKWAGIGELKITKSGDSTVTISLFRLSQSPPGAFAVGPDWENRVYYRGGDSAALIRALEAAQIASEKD